MDELEKHICPNCNIEMDKDYQSDWDERGCLFRPMWICKICAYGWYIDWRED